MWDANGRTPDFETGTPLAGYFIRRVFEELADAPEAEGVILGTSQVLMVSAFDAESGSGTYVAIDSFEGEIGGRQGSISFWHTSTADHGAFLAAEAQLKVVPGSGTGQLAGARGWGRILNRGEAEVLELTLEFADEQDAEDAEVDIAIGKLEPPHG
ncbi:hypothetical protein FM112_13105 [Gulosibacter sp. 10]|nr:hypothetical protein FM112_13105 [Gulosibacter sp. 10]